MDKFFTYSRTLKGARELGVAAFGTSKGKRGWPPKEIKKVGDMRFNSLYWIIDKDDYVIMRWVDNSVVTMVSTYHQATQTATKERKRPRINAVNQRHVEEVWGMNSKREIVIPKVINDYNNWMYGVDKADQLISNYRHNLRCRRIWLPLMFHSLDVIRINAFNVFNGLVDKEKTIEHKDFTMAMVEKFLERLVHFRYMRMTRTTAEMAAEVPNPRNKPKRRRMSKKNLRLPPERLFGDAEEHIAVLVKKRTSCKYCYYIKMKHENENRPGNAPPVSNVNRMCFRCKVHLCSVHFRVYHRRQPNEHDENE